MQAWSIHTLNTRGQLSDLLASLRAETLATKDLLGRYAPCLSLDIVIRASDRTMPSWLAVSGAAFGPGRIELTIDPSQSLGNADFSGQLRGARARPYDGEPRVATSLVAQPRIRGVQECSSAAVSASARL